MTDELRAKFEAWWRQQIWKPDWSDGWKAWLAAHASRDAEVEALKRDATQTLAAVVHAAGMRVAVRPHHIEATQRGTLVKIMDPETGGYLFRREFDAAMAKE